jgi:membrane-bound ClpP family serine protease
MKVRLIAMGCILIVIGVILLIVRGYSAPLIGLSVIGIVSAVVGVLWKPRKTADNIRNDTH